MDSNNRKLSSTLAGGHDPGVARFLAGLHNGNVEPLAFPPKEPFACPVNLEEERDANASARSCNSTRASVERGDDTFGTRAPTSRQNHAFHFSPGTSRSLPSYPTQTREEEKLSFPFVVDRLPTSSNLAHMPNPSIITNAEKSPSISTMLQSRLKNPSDSDSSIQQEARRQNFDYFAEHAPRKAIAVPTRPRATSQRQIVNTPLGLAVLLNYNGSRPASSPPRPLPRPRVDTIRTTHRPQPQLPAVAPNSPQVGANEHRKFQRWLPAEDELLKKAVETQGGPPVNWKRIASRYFNNTRSGLQCKSRWTKSLRPGIVRGAWTPEEDACILRYKQEGLKWSGIAEYLPGRIGEHICDRYNNVLDPELKKTPWTKEEDRILFEEQRRIGNKWTQISQLIPGRSENSVKNRWHNLKVTRQRRERCRHNDKMRKAETDLRKAGNTIQQQRLLDIKLRLLQLEKAGTNEAAKLQEQKRLEERIQCLQLEISKDPSIQKSDPKEVIVIDD